MLILLDFRYDLGHFSSLGEIDEVGVVKKIRISFLQEENVGLVLTEERHARRIDRPQFFPIDATVVFDV
jgi:hypothetical protein